MLGNVAQAVRFQVVGGRGLGTAAAAGWGGRGCERQTLHPEPTFKPLHLRLTPLARFHSGHGRVGTTRLQVGKAQTARKNEIFVAGMRWCGTGLGDGIRVAHDWAGGQLLLRRSLWCGPIGAAIAAPQTLGAIGETSATNSASAHGVATQQAHAHAMVGVEAALATVTTIGRTTGLDVGAHLHNLVMFPPVLGVGAAAIQADAGRMAS